MVTRSRKRLFAPGPLIVQRPGPEGWQTIGMIVPGTGIKLDFETDAPGWARMADAAERKLADFTALDSGAGRDRFNVEVYQSYVGICRQFAADHTLTLAEQTAMADRFTVEIGTKAKTYGVQL